MNATLPNVATYAGLQGRKLRVLMAEAEPAQVSKMLRSLFPDDESSLQLTIVSTISILLPTIQLVGPEILFLDLATSGQDALATVRTVHRAAPSLPLITVATTPEKSVAEQSLREGALDFVLKDVADVRTLERVLRNALERNTVSGLADLLRDAKTGLYNADGFRALTEKYLQTAKRTDGQLVLLGIRIANLAELQKEFGPTDSESAVMDTAALLKGCFRRTDLLARISHCEFAVLASDAAEPSVAILRQRLETRRVAMNEARSPWGSVELQTEVSFWAARQESSLVEEFESLLKKLRGNERKADVAMLSGR
ncbi:MAG TPA: diguanylate cyclase [Candidatus Acidoferrum sp.]|nr:diguanylate cyclase [Candidatus Acidoferrum sp.]